MRLIPIDASGTPEEGGVRLSDTARQVCEALASLYRTAGYAPPWIGYLRAMAVRAMPGIVLLAQTQPQEGASTSVLKRLGFHLAGPVDHPEDGTVWEWHWRAGTMQGR